MKTVSPFRFALWALVTSVGYISLMTHWTMASTLLLPLSGLLLYSRHDLQRQVPPKELFYSAIFLLLFFAIVAVTILSWPGRQPPAWISHPAFVLPMWALNLAVVYRTWRKQRSSPDVK